MREIGINELKELQVGVLEAIHSFCVENNITYSIACGTALGAIRHKGYIPWDDDIDIYLLRNDYNRLVVEFPELYANHIRLMSLERNTSWDRPYAKAYDDRTILLENKKVLGVNIDIYPIDDVPDDDCEWRKYNMKRRFWQRYYGYTGVLSGITWYKTFALRCIHFTTLFYPRKKMARYLNKLAQLNNNKGYSRVFECAQGMLQRHPFKKALFDNVVEVVFENKRFMVFYDADSYLTNAYGDYMQLPPEEKRVTHHSYKAYWKD